MQQEKHLGVYIHIPFCASKCGYCDFYSLAGCEDRMDAYMRAVIAHIEESAPTLAPYYIDTVYFGGGTPSYFGALRVTEIFNALKRVGRVLKSAEVTVECNPDSVNGVGLRIMRREGVNRLSFGMQSANDDLLKLIGRRHNAAQVRKAVKAAREAGYDNISLDLIYGLPTQSREDWAGTVAAALAMEPEHISCYGLKLEEGTPMFENYRNSRAVPDDDEQADMYLYAVDMLRRYEYGQYEISNFARKGRASRHNLKYWQLDDYLGFGPGAHSCIGNTRFSYVRDLETYIRGIDSGENILDEYEEIGQSERATEYIMLGLRTMQGISGEEYSINYRSDFAPLEELLRDYKTGGWAEQTGSGRWYLTPTGCLVSNILIGQLLEAQAQARLSGTPWMNGGKKGLTVQTRSEGKHKIISLEG